MKERKSSQEREKKETCFSFFSSMEHYSRKGPGILAHRDVWSYRILNPTQEKPMEMWEMDSDWSEWPILEITINTPSHTGRPGTSGSLVILPRGLPLWTVSFPPSLPYSSLSPNPQRAEGAELKIWKLLFVNLISTESPFSFSCRSGMIIST